MLPWSLRVPDDPAWHDVPNYSPEAAGALRVAYRLLRLAGWKASAFMRAGDVVHPLLETSVAQRQRLCLLYVAGASLAAVGNYAGALVRLDDALVLADDLNDTGAMIDLLYVRGAVNRGLDQYVEAATDYLDCLELFRAADLGRTPLGPAFELDVLSQLAGFTFYAGDFGQAQSLLGEARAQIVDDGRSPAMRLTFATLEWLEVLLNRASNQPERALRPALTAADVYTELGSPSSAGRIQGTVGDVLLDLAERLPEGTARQRRLAEARMHIRLAASLAHEGRDENGRLAVRLKALRLSRIERGTQNRIALIEDVAHAARALDDVAALTDAFTALGDELTARGELAAGLNCYRQALGILDGSGIPTAGIWARRALHEHDEQHPRY